MSEMITEKDIARINELYRKSKTAEGLTDAEKEEQMKLRRAYIDAMKANMKQNLESITVQNPDGTSYRVKDKHDEKMNEGKMGS